MLILCIFDKNCGENPMKKEPKKPKQNAKQGGNLVEFLGLCSKKLNFDKDFKQT